MCSRILGQADRVLETILTATVSVDRFGHHLRAPEATVRCVAMLDAAIRTRKLKLIKVIGEAVSEPADFHAVRLAVPKPQNPPATHVQLRTLDGRPLDSRAVSLGIRIKRQVQGALAEPNRANAAADAVADGSLAGAIGPLASLHAKVDGEERSDRMYPCDERDAIVGRVLLVI